MRRPLYLAVRLCRVLILVQGFLPLFYFLIALADSSAQGASPSQIQWGQPVRGRQAPPECRATYREGGLIFPLWPYLAEKGFTQEDWARRASAEQNNIIEKQWNYAYDMQWVNCVDYQNALKQESADPERLLSFIRDRREDVRKWMGPRYAAFLAFKETQAKAKIMKKQEAEKAQAEKRRRTARELETGEGNTAAGGLGGLSAGKISGSELYEGGAGGQGGAGSSPLNIRGSDRNQLDPGTVSSDERMRRELMAKKVEVPEPKFSRMPSNVQKPEFSAAAGSFFSGIKEKAQAKQEALRQAVDRDIPDLMNRYPKSTAAVEIGFGTLAAGGGVATLWLSKGVSPVAGLGVVSFAGGVGIIYDGVKRLKDSPPEWLNAPKGINP